MKPLSCSEMNADIIRRWLDDRLDVDSSVEVRQHLRECPSCFSSLMGTMSHNLFALLSGGDTARASSFRDQVSHILSQEVTVSPETVTDLLDDEVVILQLLTPNVSQEQYGLELVKKSKSKLERGTIYVTLEKMQDKGLVESRFEPKKLARAGIPRRLYKATALGRQVYAVWFNSQHEGSTGIEGCTPWKA